MMNSMNVPSKRSTLEKKLDKVILALFCLLFCMCLIGAIGSAVFVSYDYYYLDLKDKNPGELDQFNPDQRLKVAALGIFTLITLYSPIIPISLYVTVEDFFKKHGIAVITIRELFDFIVDPSINDDSVDSYLEKAQQKILARGDVISVEDEIADCVFVQSYIPKTLDDVKHAEEDVQRIISGNDTGDMYYQTITGLKHLAKAKPSPAKEQLQQEGDLIPVPLTAPSGHSSSHEIESEDETDEGEDSLTDSEGEGSSSENETNAAVDRKAARKENKKKVKEEKREARKTKVPKTVKKKKKKLAKAKKYR